MWNTTLTFSNKDFWDFFIFIFSFLAFIATDTVLAV